VSGTFTNGSTHVGYTGTQNNGAGLTQLTGISSTAGFTNGMSIVLAAGTASGFHGGYTAANVTASTIDVVGLTFNGTSTSGTVTANATLNINGRGAIQIIQGFYNPVDGTSIVAGQYSI